MSWLAIGTGRRTVLPVRSGAAGSGQLVTIGSIVAEAAFTAEPGVPQTLLHLERTARWHRGFRMSLSAAGELYVEHQQSRELTGAKVRISRPDRDAALRITYSWDAPGRRGLLTVENLDTGQRDQSRFADPQPWPMDDIAALAGAGAECETDAALSLLAVADEVVAVGLPSGLAAGTWIDTAAGPRQIQDLERGDLVRTAERGFQPVRHILSRDLPAAGHFAPIQLHAPFFGLRQDLLAARDHRVLIEGADAEYLFGADAVLVEARHLAVVSPGGWSHAEPVVCYVQVILDEHACISAGGTWVESLYLGRSAQRPLQLGACGLSAVPPDLLPQHRRIASPKLESYEAVVLVSALCA